MEKKVPILFQRKQAHRTDAEILSDKAAQVLADLTKSYLVQVKNDIQEMYDSLKLVETATARKKSTLIRENFFIKMHDLKGQGATFGYPLLTEIGRVACDLIRAKKSFSNLDIPVLKQYVDDANYIIQKDLTGDGGDWGKAFKKRLDEDK